MTSDSTNVKGSISRTGQVSGMTLGGTAAWSYGLQAILQVLGIMGTLLVLLMTSGAGLEGPNLILLVLVLLLAVTVGAPLTTGNQPGIREILAEWLMFLAVVVTVIFSTGFAQFFSPSLLLRWAVAAPLVLVVTRRWAFRLSARAMSSKLLRRRALIVGAGDLGLEVARRIEGNPSLGLELVGFCEDRALERLPESNRNRIIGTMAGAAAVVKQNAVDVVYITISAALQPRNLKIVNDLQDTTASIYFVPDVVLLDLIQPRIDLIDGLPVLAACETPFQGMAGVAKRSFDIVFSLLILVLISPILLIVAVAVRIDSSGPILFLQRRYGLDGQEILVYKFRSMRVTEDGPVVRQASRNDDRITAVGRILRRTSLDELPQFLNVLQGRMSIVGPRPHAVAHNEQYRGLVQGYMIRHKVKPGITGWAQVNGSRGETSSVDLMARRVELDLEYLRRWSLRLDVVIVLRTIFLVFRDPSAF